MDEIEIFAAAPFKCLSCRMVFENSEEHRTHYKTEFHRFNVKRKTVGLPPIPQETFEKKINEIKTKEQVSDTKQISTCTVCNKQYSSVNAYNQHLQSKKHLEAVNNPNANNRKSNKPVNATQIARQQEKTKEEQQKEPATQSSTTPKEESHDQTEEVSTKIEELMVNDAKEQEIEPKPSTEGEEEEEEKPKTPEEILEEKFKTGFAMKMELTDCLFCKQNYPDLKQNLKHMTKEHGLFIPDIEYLIDLAGLIAYLGEKIGIGNTC